jgi:predicted nucleic acid-binding Zn ribbon protein
MSNASGRGPRPLSEILGDLFTVRGYGRLLARQELEDAWNAAVGEPYCQQTRLGQVRRGVLKVTVAHSTLLEELAAFRKPVLLAALQSGAPATTIHDIQFHLGAIAPEVEANTASGSHARTGHREAENLRSPSPFRRGTRGSRGKPGHGLSPRSGHP